MKYVRRTLNRSSQENVRRFNRFRLKIVYRVISRVSRIASIIKLTSLRSMKPLIGTRNKQVSFYSRLLCLQPVVTIIMRQMLLVGTVPSLTHSLAY